ncbi:TonB-dependent receptor [Chryseobacterium sp. MYb264]|uniref:TonB-dependent receptor n=1 Tax=Chryseobacterium sp. MYb264 TaxID=2745153 RepID=UPI002E0D7F68|nr:TonB-dependent receptor [Chryseobacterium sp. MYb264]
MKKILWLLLFTFNFLWLNGQKFSIDGKISDAEKKPIENATVYLIKQKDSSIINYTSTNKEGKFSLKTEELKEPSILSVDADKLAPYSKKFDKIDQSYTLEEILLDKIRSSDIEEVKITVSPIKIKKDTIEFNASAIKVRPDSNIEELLKNINGVEIDNDGKITVNGKEVDQIMINGKPFFDKSGKIALKNIPADIIKNIQFTTTKTKEEELTGKTPKSENKTINFNIDEKKNKGFLTKLAVGYGSDKRYEINSFSSYFKDKTKISLVASSNNINTSGNFNDDDSRRNSRAGSSMKGIQRSTTVGLNYSDSFSKDIDLDALGLTRTSSNMETASKVSKTTFLPDFNLKTDSENSGENNSEQYNFNSSLQIKADTANTIYFSPTFSHSKTNGVSLGNSTTFKNGELLNKSESSTHSDSESNNFSPSIYYVRKFKKQNRNFSANISTSISENKSNNLVNSQTLFYENGAEDVSKRDVRNQLSQNKSQSNNYAFDARYTEPVSDSVTVSMGLRFNSKSNMNERLVNDFDQNTGQFSQYNLALSNSSDEKANELTPEITVNLNKKKFNLWASASLAFTNIRYNSTFNGSDYNLQRSFLLPNYNAGFQYKLKQNSTLSIYNSTTFNSPSSQNLIPYVDESNPLVTYQGNPDLKNSWANMSSVSFNTYNIPKNMNYFVNVSFTFNNNDTTNFSYYDDSGKQFTTYTNISGNKNASLFGGFSKTFKWEENRLTISPRASINYRFNKGFINEQEFSGNSYTVAPGINLTYDKRDKITIKPSYSINYSVSNYKNYSVESIKNTFQTFRLELTNYFLKTNLLIGNDFEYNTSSNISPGFKRDFYFWNASVGYSFFEKQLTAKVKVYDVLNQNQSVKRNITASYVEDREDLILRRYIMFSLTMKLNKFAGKKR